jgi:S1-C subfamily serine protease
VTFDYAHQRVVFEPNERFAEPFEGEMSGATFVRAGPDFVVRLVNPGTPAAEAGLHEGDRVTSVDGRPAAEFDLAALRAHLTGAGRAVQVDVVRGDEHFRATLTLRRLI